MADKINRRNAQGYTQEQIKSFVSRLESLHDDIDEVNDKARSKNATTRADIKVTYDDAKEAGIDKRALRAVVKRRRQEKKLEEERKAMDGDTQDSYDAIRHQLGDLEDTPLGKAALDKVRKRGTEQLEELTA